MFVLVVLHLASLLPLTNGNALPTLALSQRFDLQCGDSLCEKYGLVPYSPAAGPAAALTASNVSVPMQQLAPATSQLSSESSDGMVNFVMVCDSSTSSEVCTRFNSILPTVGDYVSRTLALKAPIRVQATVQDFCKQQLPEGARSCSDILAFARPTSFWSLSGGQDASSVLYPQALVKQLVSRFQGQLSSNDVDMVFNAGSVDQFYFPSESSRIKSNQYDVTYIALHELVHGLGMVSFWGLNAPEDSRVLGDVDRTKLLTPQVSPSGTGYEAQSIGIFDYFLGDRASGNGLNLWRDDIDEINAWLSGSNPQDIQSAERIYQDATRKGEVMFAIPQNLDSDSQTTAGTVQLHTEDGSFITGTSITHVDQTRYTRTEDFLMRPTAPVGVDLKTLMKQFGGPAQPFGRATLRILVTMGYSLKPNVDSFTRKDIGAASTGGMSSLGILTALVIVLIQ